MNARPRRRRGVVLIMALITLGFLAVVFAILLKASVSQRRQARLEERRLQASWLAESGLERAWAKLAETSDYRGETWQVPAESLRSRDAASVRITVEPLEREPGRVRVTSRADYPREGTSRARQTRTAIFSRKPSSSPGVQR